MTEAKPEAEEAAPVAAAPEVEEHVEAPAAVELLRHDDERRRFDRVLQILRQRLLVILRKRFAIAHDDERPSAEHRYRLQGGDELLRTRLARRHGDRRERIRAGLLHSLLYPLQRAEREVMLVPHDNVYGTYLPLPQLAVEL